MDTPIEAIDGGPGSSDALKTLEEQAKAMKEKLEAQRASMEAGRKYQEELMMEFLKSVGFIP